MPKQTVRLMIDRLSYGPAGVGRSEGKVVFVPGTAPGDEVEVAIGEERKNYTRGHVTALVSPSHHRRVPPCPYVTQCGGCPWQHIAYAEQLKAKEATVREQLQRIGGIADPPVLPILAAPLVSQCPQHPVGARHQEAERDAGPEIDPAHRVRFQPCSP